MSAGVIDGASPPRTIGPVSVEPPAPSRRWPRRLGVVASLIAAAAALAASIAGARYQPVVFGGYQGSPQGPHLISRQVNQVGGMRGQTYIPAQPQARGSFVISLGNTGPLPVTIESLSLLPPGMPASAINYGWPFRISGRPTYTLEYLRRGQRPPSPRPLAGMVLAPAEYITVRIPFLTAHCWVRSSGWTVDGVWVTTKSMLWTHHVFVSWTDPLNPDQGAIISPESQPGKPGSALVCPG